jgi:hypothetical protein
VTARDTAILCERQQRAAEGHRPPGDSAERATLGQIILFPRRRNAVYSFGALTVASCGAEAGPVA